MGGTNDEDNLIDLFAQEHFIAHKMLAEENPENTSLGFAWCCMAFMKNGREHRYELTPREYEEAKIALNALNKGRIVSEEQRKRIGEANKVVLFRKVPGKLLQKPMRVEFGLKKAGEN